jgi:hypothetical protein
MQVAVEPESAGSRLVGDGDGVFVLIQADEESRIVVHG